MVFSFSQDKCHLLRTFQAKEEIVGFCQADPCICLLPSWGDCVVRDVCRGRGEDLHVHGGAREICLTHIGAKNTSKVLSRKK